MEINVLQAYRFNDFPEHLQKQRVCFKAPKTRIIISPEDAVQQFGQSYDDLTAECQRLRQGLHKAISELYFWKERALFFESERDYYQRRGNE